MKIRISKVKIGMKGVLTHYTQTASGQGEYVQAIDRTEKSIKFGSLEGIKNEFWVRIKSKNYYLDY